MRKQLSLVFQTFRQKLLSGLVWNGVSAVTFQGSNLLVSILLTYILGLEGFGAFSLVVATVLMCVNFAQGCCGMVCTKIVAESLVADKQRIAPLLQLIARFAAILGGISAMVILLGGKAISDYILHRPELQFGLQVASVSMIFHAIIAYQTGALHGFAAFQPAAIVSTVFAIVNLTFILLGAKLAGLNGALIGYTLATASRALIGYFVLKSVRVENGITHTRECERSEWNLLWKLALPAGLVGFVTAPSLWLVNLTISQIQNGLAMVGVFAVVMQIRQIALHLPTLLNTVSFSMISRVKTERQRFKDLFFTSTYIGVGVGILSASFVAIFAEEILSLWQLKSTESSFSLRLLCASVIPELVAMSVYQLVQSKGHMWPSLFQIAIPRDAVYVFAAFALTAKFGIMGAAGAYLMAQVVGLLLTILLVYRLRSSE